MRSGRKLQGFPVDEASHAVDGTIALSRAGPKVVAFAIDAVMSNEENGAITRLTLTGSGPIEIDCSVFDDQFNWVRDPLNSSEFCSAVAAASWW